MEPTKRSLARTYSDRVYPDPWKKVQDYYDVQEYIAEHPDAGRVQIGNKLELPPSRVRGWINDAVPDPVRGINTAINHNWLNPSANTDIGRALVRLAAHLTGGGSISRTWVPAITLSQRFGIEKLRASIEAVNVNSTVRHVESDSRATEVLPEPDASVLGRCLSCMGVPQGSKTEQSQLPHIVDDLPKSGRQLFLKTLLGHRAVNYENKATTRLMGDRPLSFHEHLANTIHDVTGEPATADERGVTVSADAVRALGIQ